MLHNGLHVSSSKHYFEWWYFHFISQEGYVFNILIHPTHLFGFSESNYFSVSMLTPEGELRYFKQHITSENPFKDCIKTINIETQECTIIENSDEFLMNLVVSDELSFSCSIRRNESLVIDDGIIFEDNTDTSKRHYWWYPIIDGDFDAKVKFNGKSPFNLKGKVYHDHNWGNASIQKYFKGWWWCHQIFRDEDGYLIMYYLDSIDKTNDRFVGIISRNGNQSRIRKEDVNIFMDRNDNTFMESIYVDDEKNTSLYIKIKDMLKKREIPLYKRSLADGALYLDSKRIQTNGLFEEFICHAGYKY